MNFADINIVSDRLIVRSITNDDVQELYSLLMASYKHLTPWIDISPKLKLKELQKTTKIFIEEASINKFVMLVIINNGKIIGQVSLQNNKENVEIGYWIGKDYINNGFMTETVSIIIDYIWNETSFDKILIICDKKNIASRRIPEKLNFNISQKLPQLDGSIHIHYEKLKKT